MLRRATILSAVFVLAVGCEAASGTGGSSGNPGGGAGAGGSGAGGSSGDGGSGGQQPSAEQLACERTCDKLDDCVEASPSCVRDCVDPFLPACGFCIQSTDCMDLFDPISRTFTACDVECDFDLCEASCTKYRECLLSDTDVAVCTEDCKGSFDDGTRNCTTCVAGATCEELAGNGACDLACSL